MSAIPESAAHDVQKWTLELLGARGYFRALNDSKLRTRIQQLVAAMENGHLTRDEVRAAFAKATYRHSGIDELLDEFEKLPRKSKTSSPGPVSRGSTPRTTEQTSIAVQAAENQIEALRMELDLVRRHARELEVLVRSLTERAVFDATRIRGLETAIMQIAGQVGAGEAVANAFSAATADFLERRFPVRN